MSSINKLLKIILFFSLGGMFLIIFNQFFYSYFSADSDTEYIRSSITHTHLLNTKHFTVINETLSLLNEQLKIIKEHELNYHNNNQINIKNNNNDNNQNSIQNRNKDNNNKNDNNNSNNNNNKYEINYKNEITKSKSKEYESKPLKTSKTELKKELKIESQIESRNVKSKKSNRAILYTMDSISSYETASKQVMQ